MEYEGKKYYISKQGYWTRDEGRGRKRVTILLHRVVWEKHNGKIPKGFHIHHKDENRLNNEIDNLECLPQPIHASLHRKEEWVQGSLSYLVKGQKEWLKTDQGKLQKSESVRSGWKNRKSITKSCLRCGVGFETKIPQRKWCSKSCQFKNWWHKEKK
jgi:hypothetical protein